MRARHSPGMRVPQQLSLCSFGKILHQRRRFSQTAANLALQKKFKSVHPVVSP
jgi:hypothetical protein